MGPTPRVLVRALCWALVPVLMVSTGVALQGRPTSTVSLLSRADIPFLVATFACWLVGVVLTWRAVAQPAGWAFLGLGTALAWSGLLDVYASLALTWGADVPAGALAATLGDTSYVWWFVFLALVLQFTPATGDPGRCRSSAAEADGRSRCGLPGRRIAEIQPPGSTP